MRHLIAAGALAAAVAGFTTPAQASQVSVCAGSVTVVVAGTTVVDQVIGCHVVDLP